MVQRFGDLTRLVLLLALVVASDAFAPSIRPRLALADAVHSSKRRAVSARPSSLTTKQQDRGSRGSSHRLCAHPLAAPILKGSLALTAGLVVSLFARHGVRGIFWPRSRPDPAFAEPLPPGSLGCPLFGDNILKGNKFKGPEYFYREASAKLGHPRLWKFYFLGAPAASISGASLVQDLLSREFVTLGKEEQKAPEREELEKSSNTVPAIFGNKSVAFERNKEKHAFVRRLVGSGMRGATLSEAVPLLVELANNCIDRMLSNKKKTTPVVLHDYSVDYTMDFVQKQLLGIDATSEEERAQLRKALDTWLAALFSISSILRIPFLLRRSKPYKARLLLQAKIEDKIDQLLENGPDHSTLSKMLFAVDDESNAKLSRLQVIENALFLIAAGAETSSSSLTLAVFLLGLHPEKFRKLVDEQTSMGPITEEQLGNSPYLDAVVKETLRLGAVSGGFPRLVRETLVVDGRQIPKGWAVFANYRLTHQLDPVSRLPDDSHMDVRKGFEPERWLDESTRPIDFVPFGAGPRYCLGANLATLELKIFLASFARRVPDFQLVGENARESNDILWHPSTIVPRPLDGVLIQ